METKSSSPEVAIIIPCFNHGAYVEQALNSIFETGVDGLEVILINDGSTDPETLRILDSLPSEKVTVLHQENAGAAAARNHGIRHSAAPLFIPLDADNLLYKPYLIQGIQWMKEHPECAVVFGDAKIFGEKDGTWCNHPLKYEEIAFENYIDNCALIRKSAWEKAGGYDVKSPVPTREDYILWLDFLLHGFEFHHLPEFCFGYRFLNDSKVRRSFRDPVRRVRIQEYIFQKQSRLISRFFSLAKLSKEQVDSILSKHYTQLAYGHLGFGSVLRGFFYLHKAILSRGNLFSLLKIGLLWPYRRFMWIFGNGQF